MRTGLHVDVKRCRGVDFTPSLVGEALHAKGGSGWHPGYVDTFEK